MLAQFCLRLACGLAFSLALFSPRQVNPRFYRTQFLTVLALTGAATLLLREHLLDWLAAALAAAMISAFLGSIAWSLEGAPGGRAAMAVTFASLAVALGRAAALAVPAEKLGVALAADYTSAAVLGTATTAMLMGHSYLIAPSMSIVPLRNLLGGMVAAVALRLAVTVPAVVSWTARHSLVNLENETVVWLPLRWGLGFAGPLVLAWMAWQAARIRSTQSATGILYVAVIFCFLGELTGLLLFQSTALDL